MKIQKIKFNTQKYSEVAKNQYCQRSKNLSFSGKNLSNSASVFFKELFRKRQQEVFVKTFDNEPVKAVLCKPRPFDWYMKCKNGFLGFVWSCISDAPDKGDALPDYYKNKKYLFISSLESKKTLKGIGTQLVTSVVKESERLGFEGRVQLNTSTIDTKIGTPIPFYYKFGFKSIDSSIQAKIEKSMEQHLSVPRECEATTMYLPKEIISKILTKK